MPETQNLLCVSNKNKHKKYFTQLFKKIYEFNESRFKDLF